MIHGLTLRYAPSCCGAAGLRRYAMTIHIAKSDDGIFTVSLNHGDHIFETYDAIQVL
jgi:hypothetical protein